MNPVVRSVQRALVARGYNPGPLDGIMGRKTAAALKAWQHDEGFGKATGVIDSLTLNMLTTHKRSGLPWMIEAERRKGLHEHRNHKTLWDWLKLGGGNVGDPAKVPWCGDFVETAIALTLPDEPLPVNPYLAANWTKFGEPCKPQRGAVLVFWRGSPSSWKGHVGFYVGENETHYAVLGGNQSNAVTVSFIAKERLRKHGCRWPSTFPKPTGGRVLVEKNHPVTVNEE